MNFRLTFYVQKEKDIEPISSFMSDVVPQISNILWVANERYIVVKVGEPFPSITSIVKNINMMVEMDKRFEAETYKRKVRRKN